MKKKRPYPKKLRGNTMASKILIADNSATMNKIIRIILRKYDLIFKKTEDLKTTLETIDTERFDLIILSSTLQDIKSLEELKQLVGQIQKIPVLLITSTQTENESIQYTKAGFPFTLDKPFTAESFINKIKNCGLFLETKKEKDRESNQFKIKHQKSYENHIEQGREQQSETLNSFDSKDLEDKIIESLCDPTKTFMKITKHLIKDEIQSSSKEIIHDYCRNELKSIISECLRLELKVLSQKRENVTSV